MKLVLIKKIVLISFLFYSLFAFGQVIPDRPTPPRLVNDYVSLLSTNQSQDLEDKLVDFNNSTSIQIAVIIVASTNGYDISDFTFKLGEKWGVGQDGFDNGVVLLVAKEDRDVFIATGYGVESYITDMYAHQVVDYVIVPAFKDNNFYGGIDIATDELMAMLKGTYQPMQEVNEEFDPAFKFILFFIFLLILVSLFGNSSGGGTSYFPRGGGLFGGGSSGGGGFSGGGFGGFGGGSFGGGGAGGSW